MKAIKKAQNGATKKPKLLTVPRTRQIADSLDTESRYKARAAQDRTVGTYVRDYKDAKGYDKIAQELVQSSVKDDSNATRYRKLADQAEKKLKSTPKKKMKNGGSLSGLKASNKRVGPVNPKGAFTKVQKKALSGAKGKASLTKDKQLGATKMAKRGMSIKKK